MSDAASTLGPGGPIAQRLNRYEVREGQQEMARAVEAALHDEHVLFCEAGTGTGKTFAYLIPAVLSGKKVVVSTATRALQQQLLDHDLPTLERALGRSISAVALKGLGNYLCQRRFNTFKGSPDGASQKWATRLSVLDAWQAESPTGDIAELAGLSEHDEVFGHVTSSSDTRVGARCAFYERCFVTRAKREADEARIVVVNHHLFFADLALRGPHPGRVLPDYDAVIFDEAHQLEDIATLFFGLRISRRRLQALLSEAERQLSRAPKHVLTAGRSVRTVELAEQQFFDALSTAGAREVRVRLDDQAFLGKQRDLYFALDDALLSLASSLELAIAEHEDNPGLTDALDSLKKRTHTVRDALGVIVDGAPGHVTWFEASKSNATLSASPVDLSSTLRERIFNRVPSVILTSATLATEGKQPFDFVRRRLGATECEAEVRQLVVGSPFDFKNNSRLYLARHLPEPQDPQFLPQAAQEMARLIEASDGGAFVLTTSLKAMRELHAELLQSLGERRLLLQGSAPKSALLSSFQDSGSAVLIATMSFWEGVDVPGQALRLVILEKIPFAVPSDPLVQARARALEESGQNPFQELFLPTAQMMLKQGFGRLIRTQSDRGLVALMDSRALRRGYGQRLLSQLPPARRLVDLEEACRFLQAIRGTNP